MSRDLSQDRVLQIFQEGSYVRKNDGAVVLHQFTYLDYCSFISEAQWGYKSAIKMDFIKRFQTKHFRWGNWNKSVEKILETIFTK